MKSDPISAVVYYAGGAAGLPPFLITECQDESYIYIYKHGTEEVPGKIGLGKTEKRSREIKLDATLVP